MKIIILGDFKNIYFKLLKYMFISLKKIRNIINIITKIKYIFIQDLKRLNRGCTNFKKKFLANLNKSIL